MLEDMRALGVDLRRPLPLGVVGECADRRARLAIADREPLTIRGTRFPPNEKVRLLVSGQIQRTRTIRAGSRGAFTGAFCVGLERREALVVQALGSRGSRAQVDVTQTACAPAP